MADTVIVEIHADNEESFIDKNVTFTMYKIGESPGGEWLNIEIDFIFISLEECRLQGVWQLAVNGNISG